jgi:hypothetical protein
METLIKAARRKLSYKKDVCEQYSSCLCRLTHTVRRSAVVAHWEYLGTSLKPRRLTIPLLFMIYLMPESPRYLMKHGQHEKALEAFTQVRTTPLLAVRDMMYAHT